MPPTLGQVSASMCNARSYLNSLILYFWSLLCLQQSHYRTHLVPCWISQRLQEKHTHNTQRNNRDIFISLYFFLCLEIEGSIFSLITLLDMMHQNLLYLFTGIHWIEHKVSQWIHDWHFAHCTYNSERHFPDFLFRFFALVPNPRSLADCIHPNKDLPMVWQKASYSAVAT